MVVVEVGNCLGQEMSIRKGTSELLKKKEGKTGIVLMDVFFISFSVLG
jgi:hypothetical protein